ncbi:MULTISPECIES: hypothetical protein [Bacillus cereus group]|uniref:hypothetical protein n=1 Tax=Bacillus cereus group TaxID=86661 RepID=UPI001298CC3D|nr:hypothetical protein [Bacillus cereus]MRC87540.1 hypothetical protein [Bacillus thuringiensis]MDA2541196.1 hypothetical protein [Bacillus cereus]MEB8860939.1 hypothetical protein [Bacillus cereus]MEC2469332.1 hypothetical protein [Bacillus cereus]
MNVMKKAWEIARKGQKQFGGKVKEYFAKALKMSWEIVKKGMKYVQVTKVEFMNEIRSKGKFEGFLTCKNEFKNTQKINIVADLEKKEITVDMGLKSLYTDLSEAINNYKRHNHYAGNGTEVYIWRAN